MPSLLRNGKRPGLTGGCNRSFAQTPMKKAREKKVIRPPCPKQLKGKCCAPKGSKTCPSPNVNKPKCRKRRIAKCIAKKKPRCIQMKPRCIKKTKPKGINKMKPKGINKMKPRCIKKTKPKCIKKRNPKSIKKRKPKCPQKRRTKCPKKQKPNCRNPIKRRPRCRGGLYLRGFLNFTDKFKEKCPHMAERDFQNYAKYVWNSLGIQGRRIFMNADYRRSEVSLLSCPSQEH